MLDVSVLPGAEVSEARLGFGLLGHHSAGGWPAFIVSGWTFSEGENNIIIIHFVAVV